MFPPGKTQHTSRLSGVRIDEEPENGDQLLLYRVLGCHQVPALMTLSWLLVRIISEDTFHSRTLVSLLLFRLSTDGREVSQHHSFLPSLKDLLRRCQK